MIRKQHNDVSVLYGSKRLLRETFALLIGDVQRFESS
jgi:hypothetical protein